MKITTLTWMLCSVIIVISAFLAAVYFAEGIVNYLVAGMIFLLLILFIVIRKVRRTETRPDERDIKIGRAANSYSWFLSYTMVALLLIIEVIGLIELTVFGVLMITMFFMLFSRLFTRLILNKRGDV